jgi:hypothetical protein
MPQFMILVQEKEAAEAALTPAETDALLEGRAAYERQLRASAAFADGERLRPRAEGRRVPDTGAVSTASSYYVVEAASLDAATAIAQQCPATEGAELDVRPISKGSLVARKTNQQGRVFAFAVLGSAPNDESWDAVMDRIDDSTSENFPDDLFLGGVRLEARGRGRRVATGGRRAFFDGPFLESKEVIGGLFFLRMSSMDEAVEWASQSGFVKDGILEIRELWRS